MNKMKTEPSYHGILPAEVRYDDTLSASAKVLFSELTALTNKTGYSWATNAYFARLYKVREATVSEWITSLVKAGHIEIQTSGKRRTIYLTLNRKPYGKPNADLTEKRMDDHTENRMQNNTSINIKKNNNTWLQLAIAIYSAFWTDTYGQKPESLNWGRLGKTLKPLSQLNKWQWASLIWLHFNWFGASGDNDRINKNLSDNFFPLDWIPRAMSGYKAYLINSLNVDWDDEEAMKAFILPELKKVNYGTD